MRWLCVVVAACMLAACATAVQRHTPPSTRPPIPARWPSAADYGTIITAARERDVLLRDPDWRHKSFGAKLTLGTLDSVKPFTDARCLAAVLELRGNLLDLESAYQGEDWHPLFRSVHQAPPMTVCRQPPPATGVA